ncbi:MEF2-activating motif and SAP domain-containing transcriptional regulator [Chrysemys picta bellii]|uniref:MEF2-activating motif and SAP domain-containing transcriptional regulator n=1 Tax=Chrysemys picta bellii TaxID=8478 RepID=UPI0032B1C1E2
MVEPRAGAGGGCGSRPELLSILESQPPSALAPDPESQPPGGGPPAKPPALLPKVGAKLGLGVGDWPPTPQEGEGSQAQGEEAEVPSVRAPCGPAPPGPRPPLDAAYARLLQQQQLFLQLQILQQQQPPAPPGVPRSAVCAGPAPPERQYFPRSGDQLRGPRNYPGSPPPRLPPLLCPPKPELLPANLDDLTVSELRQQLRQRGLPVSGTKPALLERLKPFQVRGAPGPPPPALPPADRALREKQQLIDSLTWELQREQREADDLREELQLHKCRRGRPEGEPLPPSPPASHGPQTPAGETPEGTVPGREGFLVFCPPSCEPIGEDLELPLQITASPAPGPRSLEEELQEAIQKAQLVPSQSIEDILEEPLACAGDLLPTDAPLLLPTEPRRPPSPLSQQGAPCKKPRHTPPAAAILDFPGHYDFLTPPSSSSSSPSDSLRGVFSPEPLEGPPSPSPRPAFDPVDWLEALTAGPASGLGPGTPGGSSIFSTDFFDSPELSVNHMIDLMVEQW